MSSQDEVTKAEPKQSPLVWVVVCFRALLCLLFIPLAVYSAYYLKFVMPNERSDTPPVLAYGFAWIFIGAGIFTVPPSILLIIGLLRKKPWAVRIGLGCEILLLVLAIVWFVFCAFMPLAEANMNFIQKGMMIVYGIVGNLAPIIILFGEIMLLRKILRDMAEFAC